MEKPPTSRRRLWWQLFALLSAACVAWALSLPLFAGPDEAAHAARAAAVVRGDVVGSAPRGLKAYPAVFVRAPEAYNHTAAQRCYVRDPNLTPACAPPFTGGHRIVRVIDDEHRSLPPYYAIVGVPTLIWTAATGMYLMRVISALLCAALLASAFASALEFRSRAFGVLGVAIAVTPQVLFLGGLVNSNALEVAAAVCLWSSLLALVQSSAAPSRHLLARTTIAFAALVASRGLSLLFAAIALVAVAAVAGLPRVLVLVRNTRVRIAGIISALAALAAAGWTVFLLARYPFPRTGDGIAEGIRRTPAYLRQAVAMFNVKLVVTSQRDLPPPTFVYVIWAIAVVLIVAAAIATARRRHIVVVLALACVAIVIPITATGANVPPIGLPWWGRYGLPLWAGVTIVAGAVVDPNSVARRSWLRGAFLLPGALALLVAAQVVAFASAVRRFAVGDGGTHNPLQYLFDARWNPAPGPAVLYLAIFAVSLAALAVVLVRHAPVAPGPAETTPMEPEFAAGAVR